MCGPDLPPTFVQAVSQPPWCTQVFQFPPPDLFMSTRFIHSSSSQLPPSLFDQLEERSKAPVLKSYAMGRASHLMASNALPPAKRSPICVGCAAEGVKVAILDVSAEVVHQGNEGEICIRGDNVTKRYLQSPTADETSFTQTCFFRTGDQGKLDGEGYLTVTGRIEEFINKGGKMSPLWSSTISSRSIRLSLKWFVLLFTTRYMTKIWLHRQFQRRGSNAGTSAQEMGERTCRRAQSTPKIRSLADIVREVKT